MNTSSAINESIIILYGMADTMNNKKWEDVAKKANDELAEMQHKLSERERELGNDMLRCLHDCAVASYVELKAENQRLREELRVARYGTIGTECLCAKDGQPYRFCPIHGNKGTPR